MLINKNMIVKNFCQKMSDDVLKVDDLQAFIVNALKLGKNNKLEK